MNFLDYDFVGFMNVIIGFPSNGKSLSLGLGGTRTRFFAMKKTPPEDFVGTRADFTVLIPISIYENWST